MLFRFGNGIFLAVALTAALPVLATADIGMEITSGPGVYHRTAFSAAVPLSPKVRLGGGYEQSSSTTSASVSTVYAASLGVNLKQHWGFGMSISHAPENDAARTTGWGISGNYDGGGDKISWGVGLAFNQSLSSEYVDWQTLEQRRRGKSSHVDTVATDHAEWIDLHQRSIEPSVYFGMFGIVDLTGAFTQYGYDRDVGDFSQQLAQLAESETVQNANVDGVQSLIEGFPDRVIAAGIGISPTKNLRVSLDWSRTVFVLSQPQVDSRTLGLAYTFRSKLRIRLCYNILEYRDAYTTFGLAWVW